MLSWCAGHDVTNIFELIHSFAPQGAQKALARLPDLHPGQIPQPDARRTREGRPRISPLVGGAAGNFEDEFLAKLRGTRTPEAAAPQVAELPPPMQVEAGDPDAPLRRDFRELLHRHFPGGARETKANARQWARIALFFAGTVWGWTGWFKGEIVPTLLLPWVQWLLFSQTVHEATHGALSNRPWVNKVGMFAAHPTILNAYCWFHQHIVSHHQYTNDPQLDVDLHHLRPARLHHELPLDSNASGGSFLFKTFFTTLGMSVLWPLRELLGRPTPRYAENVTPMPEVVPAWARWLSVVPSLLVLTIPLVWHLPRFGPAAFLFFWLYPWNASSLIWTMLTQVSHIQEDCQQSPKDGQLLRWQVESSVDYSVRSRLVTWAAAGLNMQSIHHAMPTVSLCHFSRIYPEYAEICQRHGVRLNRRRDLLEAWGTCVGYVFALSNPSRGQRA